MLLWPSIPVVAESSEDCQQSPVHLPPLTSISCHFRPSEPGQQLVRNKWKFDVLVLLAGSLNIVVMEVDGRGAAGKGENWRNLLVGSLGEIDIEDQLEAIR